MSCVLRSGRSGSVILAALAVLASQTAAARAADPGFVLPGPDAYIFTIAGGGDAAPKVGRAATAVRLNPREAVYLPDGRIVIRDARFSGGGRLVAVGQDGRITTLEPFPRRPVVRDPTYGITVPFEVYDIDVEQDGGLLALVTGEPSVLRLGPAGWTPVPTPAGVASIAALSDGGLLALTDGWAWWLTRDGQVRARRRLPSGVNGSGEFTQSVTALPDGGFVAGSVGGEAFALLARSGRPFQRLARLGGDDVGFAGLPDGSLLAARGPVTWISPTADTRGAIYGRRPRFGPGDGGPAGDALIASAGVNAGPSGSVLVAEPSGVRHDVPLALNGLRRSGRIVTNVFDPGNGGLAGALRWIGAPPPGRLLAAIAPTVYRRLASGNVPVITTVGGDARVVVRSNRRVIAQRRSIVAAGSAEVSLGRRLPPGDYAVHLTVTNSSQIVTHRLAVSTRRALPLRMAKRAIARAVNGDGDGDGGGGVFFRARGCRHASATRVTCTYVAVIYDLDRSTTRCAGTVSAHLRGDGIRIVRNRTRWHRCAHAR